MDAHSALKSYRQSAVAHNNMSAAITGFKSLNPTDQRELLFWMIMSTNIQMKTVLDALSVPYKVNTPPKPEN